MSILSAPKSTPKPVQGEVNQRSINQRSIFISAALDMSWQLAIVVIIPVVGGFKLDQYLKSTPVLTFVGFGLAMIGTFVVLRHAMLVANRMPVPKLTAAQKNAIKKSYEEEDKDE